MPGTYHGLNAIIITYTRHPGPCLSWHNQPSTILSIHPPDKCPPKPNWDTCHFLSPVCLSSTPTTSFLGSCLYKVSTKSPPWNNCPSSRLMLWAESYPARNIYRCPDLQNFRMWPYLEIGALQMWLKLKWCSTAADWAHDPVWPVSQKGPVKVEGWRDESTSQGTPAIAANYWKPERGKHGFHYGLQRARVPLGSQLYSLCILISLTLFYIPVFCLSKLLGKSPFYLKGRNLWFSVF